LTRILEFIRDGGLESARQKERAQIEEERRRLHDEQLAALDTSRISTRLRGFEDRRISGIASARGLLKFLLD
jgi:hypothetical protein